MRRTVSFTALAAFLTLAGAALAPAPARAQSADTLHAERARLRAQLDKVNAEIDALKRAGGGVRGDYRLRPPLPATPGAECIGRIASVGVMPHSTIFANCLALSPCG